MDEAFCGSRKWFNTSLINERDNGIHVKLDEKENAELH